MRGRRTRHRPLPTPKATPGDRVDLPLPAAVRRAADDGDGGELWLTVEAQLAEPADWAPEGHVIAWGQLRLSAPHRDRSDGTPVAPVAPQAADGVITLGPGRFDHATGSLLDLGGLPLQGPHAGPVARSHRQRPRRLVAARRRLLEGTRPGPAAPPHGLRHARHPRSDRRGAQRRLRSPLPAHWSRVEWFGAGPGEAYPDSRQAVRVGRFHSTVDRMQTPYVRPQENGSRTDVRWAAISDGSDTIRIRGEQLFHLSARPWSDRHLAAAGHRSELPPGPLVHLHTDHAVQGLGSAACGPGVLPQHRLELGTADFTLHLTPVHRP
ncbi:beta-galactosidase domain 4-containing protein [Streptomyces sp. Y1]|uniref:beta-galactosidase n=1 Tax=Streptomyces sp. Y1 TaxID=3238634 RepID=A0AB39TWB7_9ACTN